ncbi:MAG: NAD-dependent epimerase/dehydratase family protein [Pseudomonadota bacterium]
MSKIVVLTGITGFIAKNIALQLLNSGYVVRGTLRSINRTDEVIKAITPHLKDGVDIGKQLSFVAIDLAKDEGWSQAMADADVLLHTASPFPIAQPKDEDELIRPAVDGTLRALKAAHDAGIKRVVLTSSMAAVISKPLEAGRTAYDHTDWTDTSLDYVTPYEKSKTLAEKAAWNFIETEAPDMQLTTINPGLVLGPSLDEHFGSSLEIVERVLKANDPAVPDVYIPGVDVRDVAKMHVAAIEKDPSIGKRCLAVAADLSFPQMAKILAVKYPDRKIATRIAPKWLLAILKIFDPQVRAIYPVLGMKRSADTSVSRDTLGIEFMPIEDSVLAAAESVVSFKKI